MADPSFYIPDEPPPAYEAIHSTSPNSQYHHTPAADSQTRTNASQQAVKPNATGASSPNPFLSAIEPNATSSFSSNNPFVDIPASSPALPPRRYQTSSNTNSPQTTGSHPPAAASGNGLSRTSSNSSSLHASLPSVSNPVPNRLSSEVSQAPDHSPTPSLSMNAANSSASIASPTSPFQLPSGPPPATHSPPSRPPASSLASRINGPQNHYRPTTFPTPGQPLLRNGKLLVYPKNWQGCHKCGDTGYKHGDPTHPCRKCWDKYGKTFSGALSYSVGLNDPSFSLQKPLPAATGGYYPPPQGVRPPMPHGGWNQAPSHGYMPGGYPGAVGASPRPWGGHPAPHGPYRPPQHAPTLPLRRPEPQPLDDETEASRLPDAPPTYIDASNVPENERLPAQYIAPAAPPPGSGPPMIPPHGGYHGPPPRPPHGSQFVGGFPPYPPPGGIFVSHGGMRAPSGALVVLPGDPRIGGRLCFECHGMGVRESFFFGDETCYHCRGSGRIF